MPRAPTKPERTAEPHVSTYRTSLVATATLAGLLTLLCLVVLNERRLARVVDAVLSGAHPVDAQDNPFLAMLVVLPIIAALVFAGATAVSIRVLRVSLYTSRVHRQAETYLRRHAPLLRYGVVLRASPVVGSHTTALEKDRRISDVLRASRRLLILGEAGAGKTITVYGLVHRATRAAAHPALWLGRRPLPVLLQFDDATAMGAREGDRSLETTLRERITAAGTAGLAARLPIMKRRQGLLLLCDQLNMLPHASKLRICDDLVAFSAQSAKSRIVVTCATTSHDAGADLPAWPTDFQAVRLGSLDDGAVQRVLVGVRAPRSSRHTRKHNRRSALARHRLDMTVRLPVGLAALTTAWASDDTLPYGRAALFKRSLEVTARASASADDNAAVTQSLRVLGAIAAAMRRSGMHSLPVLSNMSAGTAAALWLSEHDPLMPAESVTSPKLTLNATDTDEVCRRALERGILAQAYPAAPIFFANSILEAACAAWWLHDGDDGLGRLSAELLLPAWILPVVLWAGSCDAPADLARRLLRLADTPEASAARAGLPSREMVWPTAISLSLAATCEGVAAQLARTDAIGENSNAFLAASEQHLRDLLDSAFAQNSDGELPASLLAALREVASIAGPELSANVAYLAQDTRLSGLARGQLVTLLGSLATAEAVDLLMGLLTESDPRIRQAIPTALRHAGPPALNALCKILGHPDQHTRERAAESLAGLGDVAVAPVLVALQGETSGERVAAAKVLQDLRPPEAEIPLIGRLDDSAREVRVASALALGAIGTPGSVSALVAHAQSTYTEMRTAVAEALGRTRAPESLEVLERLLDDGEPPVRAAAATALGLLGDDRAVPALRAHRLDADPVAHNAVTTALQRLGRS